jgi:hypothetical protein
MINHHFIFTYLDESIFLDTFIEKYSFLSTYTNNQKYFALYLAAEGEGEGGEYFTSMYAHFHCF